MSTSTTGSPAMTYTIDPTHSSAHFKVRHLMIANVRGEFAKVSGTVRMDPQNPAGSEVTADIDVHSLNTRDAQRDAHLKSEDFLNAAEFPVIRFQSKKVEAAGPDTHKINGDLTIRGVTREVVLHVDGPTSETKDPWGYIRRGVEATTKISRKDFGLTWNQALETGGVVVGDEIDISLEVELVRPA